MTRGYTTETCSDGMIVVKPFVRRRGVIIGGAGEGGRGVGGIRVEEDVDRIIIKKKNKKQKIHSIS